MLPSVKKMASLLRASPIVAALKLDYEKMRKEALLELPWVLQGVVKKGYTEITVSKVSPQAGATNAPGDLHLLERLESRSGLYTVRIHTQDQSQGLRLNSWLYIDQQWVTLLKLGELIKKRDSKDHE